MLSALQPSLSKLTAHLPTVKLDSLGSLKISGDNELPILPLVAATLSLASVGYWIKKPRAPILSAEDIALHKFMLPNTTGQSIEQLGAQRPHMNRFSKKKIAAFEEGKDIDIVLIGSGLGSLTVASLMSQRGYKVLVLEQ
jgi:hypothetical protein